MVQDVSWPSINVRSVQRCNVKRAINRERERLIEREIERDRERERETFSDRER